MATPLAKQAGTKLAEEITTFGVIGLIDKLQDSLAKRIAKHIVDQEEQKLRRE